MNSSKVKASTSKVTLPNGNITNNLHPEPVVNENLDRSETSSTPREAIGGAGLSGPGNGTNEENYDNDTTIFFPLPKVTIPNNTWNKESIAFVIAQVDKIISELQPGKEDKAPAVTSNDILRIETARFTLWSLELFPDPPFGEVMNKIRGFHAFLIQADTMVQVPVGGGSGVDFSNRPKTNDSVHVIETTIQKSAISWLNSIFYQRINRPCHAAFEYFIISMLRFCYGLRRLTQDVNRMFSNRISPKEYLPGLELKRRMDICKKEIIQFRIVLPLAQTLYKKFIDQAQYFVDVILKFNSFNRSFRKGKKPTLLSKEYRTVLETKVDMESCFTLTTKMSNIFQKMETQIGELALLCSSLRFPNHLHIKTSNYMAECTIISLNGYVQEFPNLKLRCKKFLKICLRKDAAEWKKLLKGKHEKQAEDEIEEYKWIDEAVANAINETMDLSADDEKANGNLKSAEEIVLPKWVIDPIKYNISNSS